MLEWAESDGRYSYQEAKEIEAATGDGWRLPTLTEMLQHHDEARKTGGHNRWHNWSAWTATKRSRSDDDSRRWVNMWSGEYGYASTTWNHRMLVFLVREKR